MGGVVPLLGRTAGAMILGWDGAPVSAGAEPVGPFRCRIARLSALGVHVAVAGDRTTTAIDDELGLRPTGPGRLLLAGDSGRALAEVTSCGPVPVGQWRSASDHSDSLRMVLALLDGVGVAGELVVALGADIGRLARLHDARVVVVPEPGGAAGVLALLDEQLDRAERLRVPGVARDPRWTVVERGADPARHRVTESLFTVSSGGIGVRGSVEDSPDYGHPLVVAAGVYAGAEVADGLLHGPDLIDVRLDPPVSDDVRVLDLRTGVLHRDETRADGPPLRSLRFASISEPAVLAMRVEAGAGRLQVPVGPATETEWRATGSAYGGIGAVAEQRAERAGAVESVQCLVAMDRSPRGRARPGRAHRRLARASVAGFERLLSAQRAGWSDRWDRVGVTIPDDPETELRLRLALFHLWGLSGAGRELAVGARGLTGHGYSGHVFWDADAFVLPALATIDPAAAAAMVRYRLNRLAAARTRARADGLAGARFPWESARDGDDVTPTAGYVGGERVPILTGPLEEHITADVAWGVVHHAAWCRPATGLTDDEAELLRDTARYWASRLEVDPDGSAHLRRVIGPDEYHECVDDNAFTNAMARWNLRTAATLASAPPVESAAWIRAADALVDGYDPSTGRYEQFTGYFGLRQLLVNELAPAPVAADVLAGRDAIAASQVIKQPDVLMIHHLLPEAAAPGSLAPNVDFYGPRTAHGSSLSPAVMASLHARAGQADAALDLLRLSLRIDLDDLSRTTSAGVHLGACGGAWQAMIRGFLGVRVSAGRLRLDPALPDRWPELEVRFRCVGREVRVRVDHDDVAVDASGALTVEPPADTRHRYSTSSGVTFAPGGMS